MLLSLVSVSAALPIQPAKMILQENLQPNLQIDIERYSDGTSRITVKIMNSEISDYFQFSTPTGWYPIAVPASVEEADKFKSIVETHELPIPVDNMSELDSIDGLNIAIFDLNPEHYQENHLSAILFASFEVPKVTPDWSVSALKFAELLDEIKNVSITNINGQQVANIQYSFTIDSNIWVHGNIIVFIRQGNVFLISGGTDQLNWLPSLNETMDEILNSLQFNSNQ
jgi:hypothetical protein